MTEGLLSGKRGIVIGVVNDRSIAWACAKACLDEGASLILNYFGASQEKRVRKLLLDYPEIPVFQCDVSKDEEISAFFESVKSQWDGIDFIIHSVAYADRNDLMGRFINTSRSNFAMTLDVSAYSLVALAREAAPLLTEGASIIAMTYYGAEKVIPKYNVMGVAKATLEACARYLAADLGAQGVRVNCISAGPLRTLSSSAIPGFRTMMAAAKAVSPLQRNVNASEVAKTALYLISDFSSAVTGEVIHVDCGYNILGAYGDLGGGPSG